MAIYVKLHLYAIPPEGEGMPFRPFASFNGSLADYRWCDEEHPGKTLKEWSAGLSSYAKVCRIFSVSRTLSNHTFEVRRCIDKDWRKREQSRLNNRDYIPLPPEWSNLSLPTDHFCHVAFGGDAPDYVAFIESADKGERDIQTRMRAGKYIKKFFPSMSNEDVRRYAAAVQSLQGLHMTDDPVLATKIYEHGPGSCMKKERSEWAWYRATRKAIDKMPSHPVAVYFAGDLQLAWLGSADAAEARALVWPEKKLYGRIYGAVDCLKTALERDGYKSCYGTSDRCTFSGARLKIIRYDRDRVVMPYLDGIKSLEYVEETSSLHIGRTFYDADKSSVLLTRFGSQSGLGFFRDPAKKYCSLTDEEIPSGTPIVHLDSDGHISTEQVALDRGYLLTVEGVYSRYPTYVYNKDGTEVVHRHDFEVPSNYVRDHYDKRGGGVFRPRSQCVKVDGVSRIWKKSPLLDRMVFDGKSYYSNLETYYQLTGDKRRIICHGPYSKKQYAYIIKRAAHVVEPGCSIARSREIMNEQFFNNYSFFQHCFQHFHSAAMDKYPEDNI